MALEKDIYRLSEACEEHGLKIDDAMFLAATGRVTLCAYLDGWKALMTTERNSEERSSYEMTLAGHRALRQGDIARIRGAGGAEILLLRDEYSYGRVSHHSNPGTEKKLPTVSLEDICIRHADLEELLQAV